LRATTARRRCASASWARRSRADRFNVRIT
jgi:hypothetical protein